MKHPMLLLCFCCAGLLTACASSPEKAGFAGFPRETGNGIDKL